MLRGKLTKGNYGYIKEQKKIRLIRTLLALTIVLAIYVGGWIAFRTNATIFSVIAAVGSLPTAKLAVAYFIFARRQSPDEEKYAALSQITGERGFLSDVVLSSTEKLMGIDFIFVSDSKVYGYVSNPKTDLKMAEKYLSQYIKREYKINALKLYTDFGTFHTMVGGCMQSTLDEKQIVRDADIKKEILLYCA
jgi:hypothetical protein